MGRDKFEGVFMISLQLTSEAIIGCQFLKEYGLNINFEGAVLVMLEKAVLGSNFSISN
jgi:hypothetical protein